MSPLKYRSNVKKHLVDIWWTKNGNKKTLTAEIQQISVFIVPVTELFTEQFMWDLEVIWSLRKIDLQLIM